MVMTVTVVAGFFTRLWLLLLVVVLLPLLPDVVLFPLWLPVTTGGGSPPVGPCVKAGAAARVRVATISNDLSVCFMG
jgi:hypothetical protein